MIYYTALLVASNILAVLTIRFPENFNESKYIASSTFALSVMWLGFISGYFASDVINQTAVIAFTVQMSALAVLICLFGPRVFLMIFLPSRNVKTLSVTGGVTPKALSTPRNSTAIPGLQRNGDNKKEKLSQEDYM
ncbi:PREDICTED: metabotropic glutamate receptor-like [Amphimedon queenslandica]|uniref:G-protein coupled receptors family 3 profile domain-containing protein n=2 Tax=Amphimedon queenslandica TaxID=400682 RepID=A0AAN0ITE9_AMPQE|nr:PREDICTED: metabotropic glutamate receptor-like [Amphimedon queenslandica]|eukprot:XP_011409481.1 PREDICTED: metabotropic glutamate receptor-like [Amphimedon queenslandica]